MAPRVERVALTHPHHRKQGTPKRPLPLDARGGVPRAGGHEPALTAQHHRQVALVEANEREQQPDSHGPGPICGAFAPAQALMTAW